MFGFYGILLAMILLVFLVYKGFSAVIASIIAVFFITLTNQMPFGDTLSNTYLTAFGSWIHTGFAFAVLGSILGQIYEKAGAAEAIGQKLLHILCPPNANYSYKRKVSCSLIAIILMQIALTATGISGTVVLLTSFPMVLSIAKNCDIPRRLLPGLACSGAVSAAMALPGVPQIGNLIASQLLGTSVSSALLPGLLCSIFVVFASYLYMYHLVIKTHQKEEHFISYEAEVSFSKKLPPFTSSVLPLVFVFLSFSVFKWDIFFCMSGGIIIAFVLLYRYLPSSKQKSRILHCLDQGTQTGASIYFTLASMIGFSSVVQAAPGFQIFFQTVSQKIAETNSLFLATTTLVFFTLMTSSPPGAIQLGIPIFIPAVEQNLLSAAALHRTSVLSTTTFESMPYSGAAIVSMQLSKVSHREGYGPMFVCTVLIPLIATYLCVLLFYWMPCLF